MTSFAIPTELGISFAHKPKISPMIRYLLAALFSLLLIAPLPAQDNLSKKDPVRHLKEAAQLIEEGKYNLATVLLKRFESAYADVPNASVTYLGDAAYYHALIAKSTQDAGAEDLLLAYVKEYKGHQYNNVAYYQIGELYYGKKDYRGALEWFGKVDEGALKGEEKDNFIFRQSYSYFAVNNFRQAKSGFSRLTTKPGTRYYEDATYYSGMSSYFLKEYGPALTELKRLEGSNKFGGTVPHTITRIYFVQKDYANVIAYAEPKIKQPTNQLRNVPEMQHMVGMAYFDQMKFDQAAPYLEYYVKNANNVSSEDYYQLGFVLYKAGKYKEAVPYLQKLSGLKNALGQNTLYILGQCYLQLGQKSNARSAFQSASRMDFDKPTKEESAFQFAKLSYELGFNNEALLVLNTFKTDFPNSRFANEADELLAEVFLHTRAYDEAIATIERMSSTSPKVKTAYQKMTYYRAVEKFNDGLLDAADVLLDKSLKSPQDKGFEALAYYMKGDIAHIKGNYDRSIEMIGKFLPLASNVTIQHSTRVTKGNGNYINGYNYFRQKNYNKALEQFQAAFDLQHAVDNNNKQKLYPDAVLRAADCYFMTRSYARAKEYYDIVIKRGYDALDYAMYQKAIIEGLTGNNSEKLAGLNALSKNYPASRYAPDALLESGRTLMNIERKQEAIVQFNQLIKAYPNSENIPQAYLYLGLIAFNDDKYDEALKHYQVVIRTYPKTTAFNEAMLAIKDVYIAKGDADGYLRFVQTIPNASVTVSAQDSLTYQAAEGQYLRGQYDNALKGFNDYLQRFPSGYFAISARFYRAECYLRAEDFAKAKSDYLFILEGPRDIFTERAAAKAAFIFYFKDSNWEKALQYYSQALELGQ
jgi:TolA-binding protein